MTSRRTLMIGVVALAQLGLVGVGVAPQLSARLVGDDYLLRVAPLDPIDPFRGAYVSLSYPDLQRESESWAMESEGFGAMDDGESGDVFITLRQDGPVWVADDFLRERPDEGPYLACDDRAWQVRCGIDSWFLPEDDARAMEQDLADGAYAEVRVDGRGNAAVVDVRERP